MKRDCGDGELCPIEWEVVSCIDQSDDETVTEYITFEEARKVYGSILPELIPRSNVRLYAKDKQGYANCILSYICDVSDEL